MRGASTVLVLTQNYDPTADMVVEELNRRGTPVFRCDPGQFPLCLRVSARSGGHWVGSLRLPQRSIRLEDIHCAYYRRPTTFVFPASMSEPERQWARREARAGFGGIIATLPRWLNHPHDISHASYKPLQLAVAERVGLAIPPTLITSDPHDAAAFASEIGRIVYKPMAGAGINEENQFKLIYANALDTLDVDQTIGYTAHLFQAWVPKAYEVRLTVVDETLFAVRIDADSPAAHIDWRTGYDHLTYRVITTPSRVQSGVLALMHALRLRFAALDFVVTPDETWTFLEANPNGQWGWIQDATGLPIAAAIADALEATR